MLEVSLAVKLNHIFKKYDNNCLKKLNNRTKNNPILSYSNVTVT